MLCLRRAIDRSAPDHRASGRVRHPVARHFGGRTMATRH